MKITIEEGAVLCSLDNKDSSFLSACGDVFDGYRKGKLKLFLENPEDTRTPELTARFNYKQIANLLRSADRYGIEVSGEVRQYAEALERAYRDIEKQRREKEELRKQQQRYALLCSRGCGDCPNLAYDIDLPVCKKTGEILKERNVPKDMGGVLHLFNLVAFPSEDCPFNINKIKECNNERISEACESKVEA